MNYLEHLLTCAAEECGEVAKEICKALRFGLCDRVTVDPTGPPSQEGPTNRDKIVSELNDLMGVIRMLENCGALPAAWQDAEKQEQKIARVTAYMGYAHDLGTLKSTVKPTTPSCGVCNNTGFIIAEDRHGQQHPLTMITTPCPNPGCGQFRSDDHFQREYLGMPFQPTEEVRQLHKLAQEYVERTDAYDRKVFTGPVVNGCASPTVRESVWSHRYAVTIWVDLIGKVHDLGFVPVDFQAAIQHIRQPS